MKIKHTKIKNFKSLKDIEITLSNLTLITGVNSSGKSTFIQSLLLIKQNAKSIENTYTIHSILKDTDDEDFKDRLRKMIQELPPINLKGEYIDLGDGRSLLYQEAFNELMHIELSYSDEGSIGISFDAESTLTVNYSKKIESTPAVLDNLYYVCTDRATPSITYPLSEQHIRKGHIGLNGEYAAHYLSENRRNQLNIKALKHPNSKTEQLLENVSQWLGEISKGIDISVEVHNQLQIASLKYQYSYGDHTSGEYTPLNVGFGITYVLPVIISILKSKPGDLLIIENPESHLHPAGQSKVAELCSIAAASGVQVIVETHSDHFLNGVRVAIKKAILSPDESQVYYFEKAEGSMESIAHLINIDKEGRIDEWPQGFFDEWDNKLNELLW